MSEGLDRRLRSMGASHAVALAQKAHCEIHRRAGLPENRRVVDGSPLLDAKPFFSSFKSPIWCSAPRTRRTAP